ncbi:MAG: hypothetical protein QN423_13820 [Nitrososphaeraceae archaeon]|nr:hypothetical protein [Nitrososphaeraceae archaeon]
MTFKELQKLVHFEVDAFDDPTQALASFRSIGYDAFILDVKMPGLIFFIIIIFYSERIHHWV